MKILKITRTPSVSRYDKNSELVVKQWHYYMIVDEIPEVTYEEDNYRNVIGKAIDNAGNIIFSHYLKKKRYAGAFGGREIHLKMNDGSVNTYKDYWWDSGSYPNHGQFIDIGIATIDGFNDINVFNSRNINVNTLEILINDYLKHDRFYTHQEIKEWVFLQNEFFPLIVHGVTTPYMIDKTGRFVVDAITKKRQYFTTNKLIGFPKRKKCIASSYCDIKFKEYDESINGSRLIRLQASLEQILKESINEQEVE